MTQLAPSPYSKDYEITDAMFGAFRSPGGAKFFWKLFAWGTLFYTVAMGILLIPIVKSYANLFSVAFAAENGRADDAEVLSAFTSIFTMVPLILVLSLVMLFVQAVLQAAFYRAYYRNDLGGTFPFQFGRDEVNQFLSILGYFGLIVLAYILFLIVFGISAALAASDSGAAVLGGLLMFFGLIGFFVLLIYLLVAYSPATALTAYRGQVHVLAARHVSKYRFWALFGSFLVVLLISFVVQQVATSLAIYPLVFSFIDPEVMMSTEAQDSEAIAESIKATLNSTSFKVGAAFALIAVSASYAFSYLLYMGPTAFFTRQWAEAQEVE